MIWGDLDAGQRIEAEQSMKSLLSELEDEGFWAFGEAYPYSVSSQDSKPPMRWQIACVVIKRKDFPGIVKPDETEENARLPALFPKKPNLRF